MPQHRIALPFAALLLCASALTQPASAGWFDFSSDKSDSKPADDKKVAAKPAAAATAPAQDLDGAIREAQLLRTEGHYDEAVKHLSQIMLVAADDPRVVSEYGKTLAAMGRASDAVNFLNRAQQLSPNDWSVWSALGVAYDQIGDQAKAGAAYEHALALKPGEASVLNNYALSRMLAKDPDGAKNLIARAESAGGGTDPKIARNIAMIKQLSPQEAPQAVASAVPAHPAAQPPVAAPRTAVASQVMPQPPVTAPQQVARYQPAPQQPMSNAAPRPLMANNAPIQAQPQQMMQPQQPSGVVMQRVPEDPLAGPVLPRHVAAAIPAPPKTGARKQAEAAPVKTAAQGPINNANDLEARAEAIAKQLANKPAAQAQAVAAASKPPVAAKPMEKPVVKAADAKTVPAKPAVKTATKDAVPALRVSASAY